MYLDTPPNGDRLRAAIPVIVVHALLALALLRGLQGTSPQTEPEPDPLQLIRIPPPLTVLEPDPPPPPPADSGVADPLRLADPRPEGAAAPPNLKAEPPPFVAPEPLVRLPIQPQPTVTTAPIAGAGSAPSAGAAPVRGPGTGGGGLGTGRGRGSGGAGTGGGGGGGGEGPVGRLTRPRQIAGEMFISDMPEALRETGFRGRVWVDYRVETDGRVTDCQIQRSSGNRLLDQTTCRLIEQRWRYRPARDETGRPFWGRIEEFHEWESDADPPPRSRRRRDDW